MRTQRGLERLVVFADAVVAIACTLLVLPLVDLAAQAQAVPATQIVSDHLEQFGAFALSFAVIARLWVVHHRIFERVDAYDPMLIRLTLLWLFTVAFLPFPTSVLANQSGRGASVLYIGTLLASSLTLSATSAWVAAHPSLQRGDEATAYEQHWTSPALLAVALAVTSAVPHASVWPLLLLLLTGPIEALRRRRVGRTPRPRDR